MKRSTQLRIKRSKTEKTLVILLMVLVMVPLSVQAQTAHAVQDRAAEPVASNLTLGDLMEGPEVAPRQTAFIQAVTTALVETQKLTAGDGAANDWFGLWVSLDGDRALISGGYSNKSGPVYIFDFDGTTWSETQRLVASDVAPGDGFGYAISLSGDRALIGAPDDNGDDYAYSGSAYVFDFDGTTWSETQKLTAADGPAEDEFERYDAFGISVSLDGDRALIGAFRDDSNERGACDVWCYYDVGSAFIFDFDGTTWSETQRLVASDGAGEDEFGISVSLDGDRVLIGSHSDDNGTGSAYIFDFDGTNWSESQKLTAGDRATGDFFGSAVSLSGDRALIGASWDDDNGSNSGSAYVFDYDGTSWSESQKLTASDGASGDYFGYTASLSGDRALIGAGWDDDNGSNSGSAYVFDYDGTSWSESQKLTASDGASGDGFGAYSVSLDGDRALIGAWGDDDNGSDSGSAYIFDPNGPPVLGVITAPLDPLPVGTPVAASAPFSDPDTGDTHTATWDWGDTALCDTSTDTDCAIDQSNTLVTGTHTYTEAGVYTITLTLTDDVGAVDQASFEFVVVYDPNAGFVSGAGAIDSPPGAYVADATLTGQASFGFVSKYQRGANVPTGKTQFMFQVANLRFSSTAYDWLVVANHKAEFKGEGEINNNGNYGFRISAIDEALTPSTDVDLFRIKIWDKDNGDALVYDNQTGENDNADPTTALTRGTIKIQSSSNGKTGAEDTAVTAATLSAETPTVYALYTNYPNPFNPTTQITYALPEAVPVRLVVYDMLGREVARLVDQPMTAGFHSMVFEAGSLPSGTYLYRLQAGPFTRTARMTLHK